MQEFFAHPLIKPGTIELRAYQKSIAESVLRGGNTLVVMPTALGKTVIAAIVAANVLAGNKNAKVLFLAPTKPLAMQHQKSFQRIMNIPGNQITLLTGAVSRKKRWDVWDNACIIAATPQTIQNDIENERIDLKDVALLVVDEAHRCVKDYSYVAVALAYKKQAGRPLILALTASPGSEKEKIAEVCRHLGIGNIELRTSESDDVAQYMHEIETNWIMVELPEEFIEIRDLLEEFMLEQLEFFKKIGMVRKGATSKISRKLLIMLQARISMQLKKPRKNPIYFQAASKIAALLKISHANTLLETQGISALQDYWNRMLGKAQDADAPKALKYALGHHAIQEAIEKTQKLIAQGKEHPKLQRLSELLQKHFQQKPDAKAIVFNHYRDSVKNVVEYLQKFPEIKPLRFVGQATKGEKDKGMSQEEQAEALEAFKEGKYNTIVASSVAEEGLDLPSVDLVIFYEPVPSEIRSIQRRGRTGRFAEGNVHILLARNTQDEAYHWSALNKEKKMHRRIRQLSEDMQDRVKNKKSARRRKWQSKQMTLKEF
ncbi:MAG: DEAD/DEAH box helicase [Candidatus Diapherotrites archaeon]|nr:DEAD/DEAH box helicase [Candidatus Diapherotrites archaeon]